MSNRKLVYFVRTQSLDFEARVARFFCYLTSKNYQCEVIGVVNKKANFAFDSKEYICFSDCIKWKFIKVPFKLLEIQLAGLYFHFGSSNRADIIVIANHEFLVLGILLNLIPGTRVIVDLHEHYYANTFRIKWFSRLFFTKLFAGVIFANSARAKDFMGDGFRSSRVAVVRNFPYTLSEQINIPRYSPDVIFKVAIVGAASPGRYVTESIRALDYEKFADRIEIHTFGPATNMSTDHIRLVEHGPFRHNEIEDLLVDVDSSLVFYDPFLNANFKLCEPNRFFQSYNLGKIVYCFWHESLAEYYDEHCIVVDQKEFQNDLRSKLSIEIDRKFKRNGQVEKKVVYRDRLSYEKGLVGLDDLFSGVI